MKNDLQQKTIFPMKFPKKIIVLCVACLALCLAGTAISIYRIVHYGVHEAIDFIKYPFLILVCLFCIVVVVSLLVRSYYQVTDTHLITQFGIIKSRYELAKLTSIVLDRDCNQVTVYQGEQYLVLLVNAEWNDAFIRSILDKNPDVDYSFTITDEPENQN